MVQIDISKFLRTVKNYFGQFAWIEKNHYNSRVDQYYSAQKYAKRYAYYSKPFFSSTGNYKNHFLEKAS